MRVAGGGSDCLAMQTLFFSLRGTREGGRDLHGGAEDLVTAFLAFCVRHLRGKGASAPVICKARAGQLDIDWMYPARCCERSEPRSGPLQGNGGGTRIAALTLRRWRMKAVYPLASGSWYASRSPMVPMMALVRASWKFETPDSFQLRKGHDDEERRDRGQSWCGLARRISRESAHARGQLSHLPSFAGQLQGKLPGQAPVPGGIQGSRRRRPRS